MCYTVTIYMQWNIGLMIVMGMELMLFIWIFARDLTVFHTSAYCLSLKAYGISDNVLNWNMALLLTRQQRVAS